MNYMCELTSIRQGWTLPNGLCWFFDNVRYDDLRLNMSNVALSKNEKCIYLIRCLLSNGSELDCPCNRLNCSYIMPNFCEMNEYYYYPEGPLIRPYLHTAYKWTGDFKDKMPYMLLSGNVRCRGYYGYFNGSQQNVLRLVLEQTLIAFSQWDSIVCSISVIIRNYNSSMKYDNDCWKDSLTFNGHPYAVHDICTEQPKCISQYRINDGWDDCVNQVDEKHYISNKTLCSRVRKHRFQCSPEQPTCLPINQGLDGSSVCSNKFDNFLYGNGRALSELKCQKSHLTDCQLLKEYINKLYTHL